MQGVKNSVVFQNASILVGLQLASYIVPMLLLPYLARVLGIESFGELAMLWTLSAYIQIIVDFGFALWATKECASANGEQHVLSSLWIVVVSIKSLIGFCMFWAMLGFAVLFNAPLWLYIFMWTSIMAQALMPNWLFQGMQKTLPLLIFSLLAQLCAAILTIILVKSANDITNVTLASAISWSLFTWLANYYAYKKYALSLLMPCSSSLRNAINGAWHLFVGNAAVAFYANLPAFILTLFGTKSEIAVFVGAQKIVLAVQGLFSPVASALFPKIATLTKQDLTLADGFIKSSIINSVFGMAILSCAVFIFANEIVWLILGTGFMNAVLFVRIMALGPILVAISTLLYSGYIVVRNLAPSMRGFFAFITLVGFIFTLGAVLMYNSYGAAISYIAIETAVLIGLVLKIKLMRNY